MQITLLQKPGRISVEEFNASLQDAVNALKEELSASVKLAGLSGRGWARVNIEGEDSEILQEIIAKNLTVARTNLSQMEIYGNYSGIVAKVGNGVEVDVGIEAPRPLLVTVSLNTLRAQLCDGKRLAEQEIAEHYCIRQESKLTVRITSLDPKAGTMEGWLADLQMETYHEMITSGLDRIQVFDCTRNRLESALRKARLERDTLGIESSTLTAHSVPCKLGTDGVGLIPKLGSVLRKSELELFLPKRIVTRCRQW